MQSSFLLISVCYLMIYSLRHGRHKITKRLQDLSQGMHIHVREHCICKSYCLAVLLAMKLPLVAILQAPKQPKKKRQPFRLCLYRAPLVYLVSVHVTMQHLDLMVDFFFVTFWTLLVNLRSQIVFPVTYSFFHFRDSI